MPVQKGKRRKRPRNRGVPGDRVEVPSVPDQPRVSARNRRPRQRWKPPLWFNVALGLGMIAVGVVFFTTQNQGMSVQERLLLLLGYLVVAGFYLGKAFQQYRARRQT